MGRRERCETPPQTTLHSGTKSLSPGKTAFQRRASRVPPRARPRVRPSVRPPAGRAPEERGLCPGQPRAARSRRPQQVMRSPARDPHGLWPLPPTAATPQPRKENISQDRRQEPLLEAASPVSLISDTESAFPIG